MSLKKNVLFVVKKELINMGKDGENAQIVGRHFALKMGSMLSR